MKDHIVDANFPRTLDQRVYHLGIRAGEVANRIVTVGSPSRAHAIANYLDHSPKPFTLTSERGFTTITGRYKNVPVSIVSIGMGYPNADFFVREVRECLTGDMVVVRLGSCGALIDVPVGSVIVPKSSIAVTRNYDFDFVTGQSSEPPYRLSKPVLADPELHRAVQDALERSRPSTFQTTVVSHTMNASADSFYSSQGRITSFPDHNETLIHTMKARHPDLATLEMETFHILHLAANWPSSGHAEQLSVPPISTLPVSPVVSLPPPPSNQPQPPNVSFSDKAGNLLMPKPRIRAAAAQMVFASRTSQDFITPDQVAEIEAWCGKAVLEALIGFGIEPSRLHDEAGSVWELRDF
ncbi:purine and uridine phosphorylase [Laetiporus sulphureus 93-53]|uniref:Purine and uridine phosphorylase n=1 Tax=Laetiporus sulphureus 93-53 TaxID=1314785 RepID=A0A165BEP8_9APHY|nr:purine and uridine phosphorylase [Laetiporus sulphureus 93-53]KZT00892.1 purine and uridine phosphorylase [Laetiporus sulphureus 93-53]